MNSIPAVIDVGGIENFIRDHVANRTPNLSRQGANVQARRMAPAHGLKDAEILDLIENSTEGPLLGLFGPQL